MTLRPRTAPLRAALAALLAFAAAAHADEAAQRTAFLAAEAAIAAGDTARARTLEAGLAGYPLLPYLHLAALGRDLKAADSAAVRAFLEQHRDTPLAPRLRTAWLKALAGQRRWDELIADYRPGAGAEPECAWRRALLERGRPDEAVAGLEALWRKPQPLPALCDAVVEAWAGRGGLSPALAWGRLAAAFAAGSTTAASETLPRLSTADQPWGRLWLAVDADPARLLEAPELRGADPRAQAIVLHGLGRWIERDSAAAAPAFDTVHGWGSLTIATLAPLARRLAVLFAARNDADARRRLDALPPGLDDEASREWRVRLGLAQGDWAYALAALGRMPPEQAADPAWRYWKARALEAGGSPEVAITLYRELAGLRDYYGFLAAERLHLPYALNARPLARDQALEAQLAQRPALARARELVALGRSREARAEWAFALDQASAAELASAARLAGDWGWHGQAIVTLARAGVWDALELRFPTPWRDEVTAAARATGLPGAWVYAIMRQESALAPDARSGAGALGLMQLLPGTGRDVAARAGLAFAGSATLLAPDANIALGARYLRELAERFQGDPVLATAAYNAGPSRVRQWLPAVPVDADVWIETIPYAETRTYVKRIWEYRAIYEARLGQPPRGFALERIGTAASG